MAKKRAPMNWLDRLVAYVSPAAGVERLQARSALGGYTGASRSRRSTKNWSTNEGSANAILSWDLPVLRSRSRDLVRNAPLASGAIKTKASYTVGHGLTVNPAPDRAVLGISKAQARRFQMRARAEFELACRTLDYTSVQHFPELQILAFQSWLENGDTFALRRYRQDPGDIYALKIQMIEADRVSNPGHGADTETRIGGVEITRDGRPIAYHIANRHPGDLHISAGTQWRRVPARYNDGSPIVLHVMRRDRIDQVRGIPMLATIIDTLKQYSDYGDAELRASVVSAMFTVFVTSEAGSVDASPVQEPTGANSDRDDLELKSGMIVDLEPNEKIEIADPKRPNQNFEAFVQAVAREIGVGLDLPYELLVKHFSASYSASRAALEMAWTVFRRDRAFFVRVFCQPIYEMVIQESILLGRLDAPGFADDPVLRQAWLKAEWRGPARIALDPKKDAEADAIDIGTGVKTREQVISERTGSGDFDSTTEQLGHEQKSRDKAGLQTAEASAASKSEPTEPAGQNEDDSGDDESQSHA